MQTTTPLVDPFGRTVDYLRLSITDRCDFRCTYCMAEEMTFLPRKEVLSLEELATVGRTFCELGVRKIRLTGGEPLVRHNVMSLVRELGQIPSLKELCLTTNASKLKEFAQPLRDAGVNRINISLDSLNTEKFKRITRTGQLEKVLEGIQAAKNAGFDRIKLNAVILKNHNSNEVLALLDYALSNGLDISFIEEMPLGNISEHDRKLEFISSQEIRNQISKAYTLSPSNLETGGPSRYWKIKGAESRIGFISPHSENFCASCNRVRVSVDGRLLLCLGNEHSADLRSVLRAHANDTSFLKNAIIKALQLKPEKHHFDLNEPPQILRFMNATGG